MKRLLLSERLAAAAKYIEQDSAVADIGTDHGYIPVYLGLNNIARRIIAADVKKGPLASAQSSAEEYGVSDRIEFVQTDGLNGLENCHLDTVVIAGMGGETIADILHRAPWTQSDNMRLILQPQSKQSELLSWLMNNGYDIFDASLALDDGRIYTVILAGARKNAVPNNVFKILSDKREPLLPVYLTGLIAKTRRAVAGLEKSTADAGNELKMKKRELEALILLKEETDKWQK